MCRPWLSRMTTTGIERMIRTTAIVLGALALLVSSGAPSSAQEQQRRVQTWTVSTDAPGWIGVSLSQTSYTMTSGQTIGEVVIERVWEGSPAERAGIRPGDRILRINGEPVNPRRSMEQLRTAPDESVTLVLLRGADEITVDLITAERPQSVTTVRGPESVEWTAQVDSLTRQILLTADSLKVSLRLLDGQGPALFRGDSLVVIGGEASAGASTVHIRRGESSEIEVLRPGTGMRFGYTIPEPDETAPFGVFVHRTPETDSLLQQRKELRAEVARVRLREVEQRRELARELPQGQTRVSEDDPRLVGLVRTREKLTGELVQVEEELARASLEVLTMNRAFNEPGGVYVREFSQQQPVRPVFPYLFGERFVAGAELTNLNPELAEYFPASRGVLVTEVVPGSPAFEAGLKGGDVIIRVGDTDVDSVDALRRALVRLSDAGLRTLTVAGKEGMRTIELKR